MRAPTCVRLGDPTAASTSLTPSYRTASVQLPPTRHNRAGYKLAFRPHPTWIVQRRRQGREDHQRPRRSSPSAAARGSSPAPPARPGGGAWVWSPLPAGFADVPPEPAPPTSTPARAFGTGWDGLLRLPYPGNGKRSPVSPPITAYGGDAGTKPFAIAEVGESKNGDDPTFRHTLLLLGREPPAPAGCLVYYQTFGSTSQLPDPRTNSASLEVLKDRLHSPALPLPPSPQWAPHGPASPRPPGGLGAPPVRKGPYGEACLPRRSCPGCGLWPPAFRRAFLPRALPPGLAQRAEVIGLQGR